MRKAPIHRIVALLGLLAIAAWPQDKDQTPMSHPGSHGFYGPITTNLKAGEDAPDLQFTKVLHSPDNAQWNPANAFTQTTVLVFMPLVSRNPQVIDRWNGLQERFAARSVQFVLITQEVESSLVPWLAQHPVSGWLFYDPTGATGRAYGLEQPNTVYVGADRKIIGFSFSPVPLDRELNAVLEGRVVARPVNADPALLRELAKSGKVMLLAEPSKMPGPEDNKPKFPPSYEVHIAPSTTQGIGSTGGPDQWSVSGFDLKSIIAQAYGVEETRVDFQDAAQAGKRYDVALVLPQAEDRQLMLRRVQDALKKQFNLTIASEDESMDVYVVTAPYGPGSGLKPSDSMGGSISSSGTFFSSSGEQPPTAEEMKAAMDRTRASTGILLDGIDMTGGTIDDLCRTLESGLNRKVIDETHLTGHYDINVTRGNRTRDEFFDMLREQLGLALTPEKRQVSMLVVRSN